MLIGVNQVRLLGEVVLSVALLLPVILTIIGKEELKSRNWNKIEMKVVDGNCGQPCDLGKMNKADEAVTPQRKLFLLLFFAPE